MMVKKLIRESLDFLLHAKYCPYWMPWFYADEDMKNLQLLSLQRARKFKIENGKRWSMLIQIMFWPLLTLIQATRNMFREEARYVARQDNCPGMMRQFFQQLILANRYNIAPIHYYSYRLWVPNNFNQASRFIIDSTFGGLLEVLREDADAGDLNDKVRFFHRCKGADLPVAPVLAVFNKSEGVSWYNDELRSLPHVDLFVKPVDLTHGEGVECWIYEEGGWERQGVRYSEDELLEHFLKLARERDCLLMPRIVNHPNMKAFTTGALATARIVTCYTPGKNVLIIPGELRMPVDSLEVDNISAGGIGGPILGDGLLGNATASDIMLGTLTHHPKTGEQIAGVSIPYYRNTLKLCAKAHKAFPEIASIGWDVAITPEGPILLEANSSWSAEMQVMTETPLGKTDFVEWANDHLKWLANNEQLSRTL